LSQSIFLAAESCDYLPMTDPLAPHLAIALRHTQPGLTATPIPRLEIDIGQTTVDKAPCLYRSMICFILQGSKKVAINGDLLSYDPAHYLISAIDLPLVGQIRMPTAANPMSRCLWSWTPPSWPISPLPCRQCAIPIPRASA